MLIETIVADAFGTNCYVVADGRSNECLVIDPGIGIADRLDEVYHRHHLKPVAVMLTHGHLDHTFSVTPVCRNSEIPAYIHPDDSELLRDPLKGFSANMAQMMGAGFEWTEPDDVATLTDHDTIELAGMKLQVQHAPGHTPGSAMFNMRGRGDEPPYSFTGDVLFAGSIGRTDLPGGSMEEMTRSLGDKVLPMDDNVVILPGHGPRSTIGDERRNNRFLKSVAAQRSS
ncbi:MBL fold metallo-hydrolase [Haloglycomyces albus]|uniref:MBL fold metallo-hydrolase n=1 Tax=Haloglycomyces albus TaxID=526067 RepID=UPI00046D3A03|nr:MBL fold metallo-hydrolase [Haloglycomyces albus]